MSSSSSLVPSWDTSSLGQPPDISTTERVMLHEHLAHCAALQAPYRVVWFGISRLHRMLAERTLTGTLLIALLAGIAWLMR